MGKIIGNKKMPVISYSQEEVKEITNELNTKIVELTEALDKKNKKDSDKESK